MRKEATPEEKEPKTKSGIWKYQGELLFGVLLIYVLLLALGTVGVLFDIEWILDLPMF